LSEEHHHYDEEEYHHHHSHHSHPDPSGKKKKLTIAELSRLIQKTVAGKAKSSYAHEVFESVAGGNAEREAEMLRDIHELFVELTSTHRLQCEPCPRARAPFQPKTTIVHHHKEEEEHHHEETVAEEAAEEAVDPKIPSMPHVGEKEAKTILASGTGSSDDSDLIAELTE